MGSWSPPHEFPDLSGAKWIGFDIETKDPDLTRRGPGFIRKNADVVGFSVAANDCSWYFPFGHLSGGNLDRDACVRFLRNLFKDDDRYVVGANLQYELEGLWHLGVDPRGRFIDVQIAEAIIEEERDDGYDLGTLSLRHLGRGKDESLLIEAAAAYGISPKGGLWKLHSKYVGPYGEWDAAAPLQIFGRQLEILKREGLTQIFELECRLLPILWKMRLQGIPVDLERARSLSAELKKKEDELRDALKVDIGFHIDEWSGQHLEALCTKHGIWFPRTPKGNPSFTGDFLSESSDPMLQRIAAIRELNRTRQTFVDEWVFSNEINGWIHPQWRQLVSDEGGARTGRMAAGNPNPQQVPSRSEFAALVRAIFRRPDGGLWGKLDYSQQEPRLLTHYAYLRGFNKAAEVRAAYINDVKMDIYKFLAETAGISRRESKDLTLGRMYGMGKKKLASKLGVSVDAAESLLHKFDAGVPFVRDIAEDTARLADKRGWVRTLCGRKRHFNYWEPVNAFDLKQNGRDIRPVNTIEEAEKKWPGQRYRRAMTHKALNALIQGSAADMTKTAIVTGYEEQKRIPYMAVHDELDGPVNDQDDANKWKTLAETCVDLSVPIRADLHVGESWK